MIDSESPIAWEELAQYQGNPYHPPISILFIVDYSCHVGWKYVCETASTERAITEKNFVGYALLACRGRPFNWQRFTYDRDENEQLRHFIRCNDYNQLVLPLSPFQDKEVDAKAPRLTTISVADHFPDATTSTYSSFGETKNKP